MNVKDNVTNFFKNIRNVSNLNKTIEFQKDKIDYLEKSSRAESISWQRRSGTGNEVIINKGAILTVALQDACIRAAIERKKDSILADGYDVVPKDEGTSESERQANEFEEWAKTAGGSMENVGEATNFDEVLRRLVDSFIVGDDFYIEYAFQKGDEIILTKPPKEIYVLDWQNIIQNRDEKGNLKDLEFDSNGKRKSGAYHQVVGGTIKAIFDKTEILHGNYYSKGSQSYGNSLIGSILFVAATKRFGQTYSGDTFLHQKPKGKFEIYTDDVDEFNKIKNQIEEAEQKPHGDLIVMVSPGASQNPEGTVKYVDMTKPKDLEYKQFIEDSRNEIFVGMGVPPGVVFAAVPIKGWDANIQLHVYDKHINGIRSYLESIITDELFPRFGWNQIKFTFKKVNKRDELNEWRIATLQSKFMTINEIRKERGLPEIEDGDRITGVSSAPTGNIPSIEQEQGNRGLMAQSLNPLEVETTLHPVMDNVKYKNPNYFRKSFGGWKDNTVKRFNPKQRVKINIDTSAVQSNKKLLKDLFKFENEYTDKMLDLLKSFINEVEDVLTTNVASLDRTNLIKIANPDKEFGEIDELVKKHKQFARDEAISTVRKTYDFAIDGVAAEMGVTIAKSSADFEALNFFDKWNVELIEGAYSDISKSIKTEIRLGLQAQEGIPEIVKRIKGNVKGKVERIWKNRFRTIARTEVGRAMSEGRISGYEKSGLVEKVQVLIGTGPDDVAICERTFGGPAGGIGKTFTLEQARGLIPAHPNCTCSIIPVIE